MKSNILMPAAAAVALIVSAGPVEAECDPGKPGTELTGTEAQAVYECVAEKMHAGYAKGAKRWIPKEFVADYRGWTRVSKFPAAPGFHGERFLVTYVNGVGAASYMKYEEDPVIPAGTVIAKESFSVDGKGKLTVGPLFIMQKVDAGKSPDTMDWYYMMVDAKGRPQAVNVITACSTCHKDTFGYQGGLGYPVEEARATN